MESTFLMGNSLYDDDTLLPGTKDSISLLKLIARWLRESKVACHQMILAWQIPRVWSQKLTKRWTELITQSCPDFCMCILPHMWQIHIHNKYKFKNLTAKIYLVPPYIPYIYDKYGKALLKSICHHPPIPADV